MDRVKKALRKDVTNIENCSFHENMMFLKAKKKILLHVFRKLQAAKNKNYSIWPWDSTLLGFRN